MKITLRLDVIAPSELELLLKIMYESERDAISDKDCQKVFDMYDGLVDPGAAAEYTRALQEADSARRYTRATKQY